MEQERRLPRQLAVVSELAELIFEHLKPAIECLSKGGLLVDDYLVDELFLVEELGIGVRHQGHNNLGRLMKEGFVHSELYPVPNRAAHDSAEDVTSAFV